MRVSDYGGNAYGREYHRTTGRKTKVHSFRCSSCGHLTYYTPLEVRRMKSQPRCGACGGLTEETESSFKKRTGVSKSKISKLIGISDGYEVLPYECPSCPKRFRSPVGLKLHCEQSHGAVHN